MAVEDPALGREQGRIALQVGLQGPDLGGSEDLHALDVIGARLGEDGVEPFQLFRTVEDHELATAVEGNAALGEEGIEGPPPLDAQASLE